MNFVIVGNGAAGIAAAEAIRKLDQDSPITILAEEPCHYYSRIRLIDYLAGKVAEDGLLLKRPEWYQSQGIEVRLGERVVAFDQARRELSCASGACLGYDRLLIATGAKSFLPAAPGIDQELVFTLRTLADARRIVAAARGGRRVVMLGGGILSLEAASALQQLGCEITVVEYFERLLPRQMDRQGSLVLQGLFEARGMRFFLGAKSYEVTGTGTANGVRLADGTTLPGDLVLVGAGVRPDTYLAQASGLAVGKGIEVNDRMETAVAGVFAAGDVAQHRGVLYGIWPAAMQQGQVAGTNMAGGEASFAGLAMSNTLKVAGIDLFSLGDIDPDDKLESVVFRDQGLYKKAVFKENMVAGAILLGDLSSRSALQRAMSQGRIISDADRLAMRQGDFSLTA